MTAEAIAAVCADLDAGRIVNTLPRDRGMFEVAESFALMPSKVIDATSVYEHNVAAGKEVYLYEDHPCIAPPFRTFRTCYVNEHGNVTVMSSVATRRSDPHLEGSLGFEQAIGRIADPSLRNITQPDARWRPAQPVDWDRVEWILDTFVFVGGRSRLLAERRGQPGTMPIPTSGPVHLWRFAIYPDGEPADLHWVQLLDTFELDHWDGAQLVLLGALNFLNCRNVELVEPERPRAERRRLERTAPGVKVHELHVFPAGKSSRSARKGESLGVPLTAVRGHFSTYGPEYGKGLLFGKLSGRFWIPGHARGSSEHGEHRTSYKLRSNG